MHGASCAVASVLLVATAEPWPPQVSVNATLLVAGLIRNGEDDAFLVECDVFWFGGFCWHRLFFVGKGLSLLEDLTSSIGQSLVETRLEEFLPKLQTKVEGWGRFFEEVHVVLVENDSTDGTHAFLVAWAKELKRRRSSRASRVSLHLISKSFRDDPNVGHYQTRADLKMKGWVMMGSGFWRSFGTSTCGSCERSTCRR
ncbi:unnamed protein product [Durusdinium trenchii]|uniref:Glycosyltransferase 2-like domain-containing protein n=1 Tax=Durusdinium trenchii TaxID=1381693 RepID=A0ABP0M2Y3_9DINO